ncbi:hypothetical protein [Tardiphaga sp. 839_C3_N1_4]|jgi:hypothetical protein|uniref:hypothetical protein n=1 Tax=Tardiphaga sp. 839_C3_N1_4 TaxID=3240761 RepID=UPI003F23C0BB
MIAAEASAFLTDDVVSYLWTCDTCGYGFVTIRTATAEKRRFVTNGKIVHFEGLFDRVGTSPMTIASVLQKPS